MSFRIQRLYLSEQSVLCSGPGTYVPVPITSEGSVVVADIGHSSLISALQPKLNLRTMQDPKTSNWTQMQSSPRSSVHILVPTSLSLVTYAWSHARWWYRGVVCVMNIPCGLTALCQDCWRRKNLVSLLFQQRGLTILCSSLYRVFLTSCAIISFPRIGNGDDHFLVMVTSLPHPRERFPRSARRVSFSVRKI